MNNRMKVVKFNVAVTFVSMFFYLTTLRIWSVTAAFWTALAVLAIIFLVVASSIDIKEEDVNVYAIFLAVFGAALSLVVEDLFHRSFSTVGVVIAVTCMLLATGLYFKYARFINMKFDVGLGFLTVAILCQSAVVSSLVIIYAHKLT